MIQAHRCILLTRLKSYPCKYSRAVFLRILYLLLFWQHDNYYATLQKKALWEHYCILNIREGNFLFTWKFPFCRLVW